MQSADTENTDRKTTMKISVVTVCLNSRSTIEDTIRSVAGQKGVEVEYIVIDGGSSDGTLAIIDQYSEHIDVLISEPDRGIYDAMNKGLAQATGVLVGFLNSDDYFVDEFALADLASKFERDRSDCVFADVAIVNASGQIQRIYSGARFDPRRFEKAYAVPHPTFYARTSAIKDAGGFDPSYNIAGDFHLMVKLLRLNLLKWSYLPRIVAKQRLGGVSTGGLSAYRITTRENIKALRACGLKPNELAIWARFIRKSVEVVRGLLTKDGKFATFHRDHQS
jgi:glycosyltransferase involved in cell wall biosynthesis